MSCRKLKRINIIIAILSFVFVVFFVKVAYAASVLVDGSKDEVLSILANTKYLEGKPVLIFINQLQDSTNSPADDVEFLVKHINNFVLTDAKSTDRLQLEKLLIGKMALSDTQISYILKKDSGIFSCGPVEYRLLVLLVPLQLIEGRGRQSNKDKKFPSSTKILKVDNKTYSLGDFTRGGGFSEEEGGFLEKKIYLASGSHTYEKVENPFVYLQWLLLESCNKSRENNREEPSITFKRVNPTKYFIKVTGAKSPFWLVFSEAFHRKWKLYEIKPDELQSAGLDDALNEYHDFKTKEAEHEVRFTPSDIRYLFKRPLKARHFNVNGHANGWYLEPDKINMGEDFVLMMYFLPQSFFYLGLAAVAFLCIICVMFYAVLIKIKK